MVQEEKYMKIPGNREQNRSNAVKEAHLWLIPLLGIAFLLWYIKNATCDVVYSDYIRLVNSYLPDVCDPKKFFVADVLTRIPINWGCKRRICSLVLFCLFPSVKGSDNMVYSPYGGHVQPEQMGNADKWKRLVPFLCLCLLFLSPDSF